MPVAFFTWATRGVLNDCNRIAHFHLNMAFAIHWCCLTACLLAVLSGKLENEGNLAALYQLDGSALDPRVSRHIG